MWQVQLDIHRLIFPQINVKLILKNVIFDLSLLDNTLK